MQLDDTMAVAWGRSRLGRSVEARALARGAVRLFLCGRTTTRLNDMAGQIFANGGSVEVGGLTFWTPPPRWRTTSCADAGPSASPPAPCPGWSASECPLVRMQDARPPSFVCGALFLARVLGVEHGQRRPTGSAPPATKRTEREPEHR